MESLVITWRELLIVVVLVLAVYIAEVLLLTRSSGRPGLKPWRSKDVVPGHAELESIRAELRTMHEQMGKLQGELEEMKQAQASTPYSQAIQLAQQGLDASLVAANCGISRGEAELIVALYRNTSSP